MSCGAVPCSTVVEGTRTVEVTVTGLPLKCSPTSATETTTTSVVPTTTRSVQTPPPLPTDEDECDIFDPTCWKFRAKRSVG